MRTLTDCADQAVILPLVILVGFGFTLIGWSRGAIVWFFGIAATFAVIAALKLVFIACGEHWTGGALTTPSGHTASAAVVYGSLVVLACRSRLETWRPSLAAPFLAATLIGATRLFLHRHTPAEVAVGGLVGIAGAYILIAVAGRPPLLPLLPFGALASLALILLYGDHLPIERQFHHLVFDGIWPPSVCRVSSDAQLAVHIRFGA
ncbi:MAG TPA: phosphatase PAP2 family protein [Acetobacteraceae bacterium]|nr:phosphatase PAP2 family protein [Acetobacteraceae bacterium]